VSRTVIDPARDRRLSRSPSAASAAHRLAGDRDIGQASVCGERRVARRGARSIECAPILARRCGSSARVERESDTLSRETTMNVEQCMTRDPVCCGAADNLERAAQIMWEGDCGCVPVLDGGSKVIGMITDRDICMAAYTRGVPLYAVSVESAMARAIVGCRPSDTLETALGLLSANQLRRLPVLDAEGGVVGIVTIHDIARQSGVPGHEIVRSNRSPGRDGARQRRAGGPSKSGRLSSDEVVSALRGIARPRTERTVEANIDRKRDSNAVNRSVLRPKARPGGSSAKSRARSR
jgi:CBS domain-containing protein